MPFSPFQSKRISMFQGWCDTLILMYHSSPDVVYLSAELQLPIAMLTIMLKFSTEMPIIIIYKLIPTMSSHSQVLDIILYLHKFYK